MKKPTREAKPRGKSWCYWMEWFNSANYEMADHYPYPSGSPWLLSKEAGNDLLLKYDAAADEACERFALDGEWPDMTPEVRFSVCHRLAAASDFSANLYFALGTHTRTVVRPPDLSITPISKVMRFFLIDWWRRARSDIASVVRLSRPSASPSFCTIADIQIGTTNVTLLLVKARAVLDEHIAGLVVKEMQYLFPESTVVLCNQSPSGKLCFWGKKRLVSVLEKLSSDEFHWESRLV